MGSGWYIVGWNDQILTLVLTKNDELVSNYYAASFDLLCAACVIYLLRKKNYLHT